MFGWLRRILGRSEAEDREAFFQTIDGLNREAGGGKPIAVTTRLGSLKLPSGTLLLGDPQYLPSLEIPNIQAAEVEVSASLRRYPSSMEQVSALQFAWGDATDKIARRKIGEVAIDSAALVVVDKRDFDRHWTETGPDRIGVISIARDDTVLRLLTRRFQLQAIPVNSVRAEVVGPVSEELEAEMKAFLSADRRYADFPFIYFHVQTNNSFDRANRMPRAWEFMPVGNLPEPLMFVCSTGRGDGCYDVLGQFDGAAGGTLTINFIDG
jgi:hypothetical protein